MAASARTVVSLLILLTAVYLCHAKKSRSSTHWSSWSCSGLGLEMRTRRKQKVSHKFCRSSKGPQVCRKVQKQTRRAATCGNRPLQGTTPITTVRTTTAAEENAGCIRASSDPVLSPNTTRGMTRNLTMCNGTGPVSGITSLRYKLYTLCAGVAGSPNQIFVYDSTTLNYLYSIDIPSAVSTASSMAACESDQYIFFGDLSGNNVYRMDSNQTFIYWSIPPAMMSVSGDTIRTDDSCNVIVSVAYDAVLTYDKDGNGLSTTQLCKLSIGVCGFCHTSAVAVVGGFISGCGMGMDFCNSLCLFRPLGMSTPLDNSFLLASVSSVVVSGGYLLVADSSLHAIYLFDTLLKQYAVFAESVTVDYSWLDVYTRTYYYADSDSKRIYAACL